MAPRTNGGATGSALVTLARKHVGERYVLGALAPKDNGNWKGPWDCAEFFSWVVFQTSGILYGCNRDFGDPATADAYTGFCDRDARTLGEVISLDAAARTPGAAVLRVPQPGAIGHVVFSDGTGGTIEAHSSADGVISSRLAGRRWDMGVLVPGIKYTQRAVVPVTEPSTVVYRLMTPMMTGPVVRRIQQALKAAGFNPGAIDGEFGPHTQAAVVAFQLSNGLVGDGEVGELTASALGVAL
ncbi:peptidoglycan-binding domain-containing protein [Edaphobacter aggregans]|uniref:peptidoglycan-binding domain-containing protein n=1 Tax=Edaphobacter aggregans TaxID=570835 RepID=UPI00068FA53F|nr:peptidoglycan-binding domain-containing protein [Edaphobacter aggregans]